VHRPDKALVALGRLKRKRKRRGRLQIDKWSVENGLLDGSAASAEYSYVSRIAARDRSQVYTEPGQQNHS
jgi:hypothetical protein